jgi:hypothetical protein
MPRGPFPPEVCVLLERPVAPEAIESAPAALWQPAPAVAIEVVDRPWPGVPSDPLTAGALARAVQQCWGWEPGRGAADRHAAFLRLRCTATATSDDDPRAGLTAVTEAAAVLLALPGALCYFNPRGEVLRDAAGLRAGLDHARAHGLPPLDVWCNVRLFPADDGGALMDTVGNGQLGLPDVEACFGAGVCDGVEVDYFLRDVTLYLLRRGAAIGDGDLLDGPGDLRWGARRCERGLADPPRPVLRLVPEDGSAVPDPLPGAGIKPQTE